MNPVDERTGPRVGAVVLAFGAEPWLEDCVRAVIDSRGVDVSVVVVDNGSRAGATGAVRSLPGVEVVTAGHNLGFAGGCNLGVSRLPAVCTTLVLVNSDALLEPGALLALHRALEGPGVGLVTGSVRLMDRPEVVNSVGNPVHFSGISWAGGLGEPAGRHVLPRRVASASGAVLGVRRSTWESLEGFWDPMFAYCEDLELSLRCWQRGWSVSYVPAAVALHDYQFNRNALKMYLVERNRLVVLATLLERRTLLVLAPALVALELALLVLSLRQGWWRDKLRGWVWILRHRRDVLARRHVVQQQRTVPDVRLLALFEARIRPGAESALTPPPALNAVAAAYWWVARRLLAGRSRQARRSEPAR